MSTSELIVQCPNAARLARTRAVSRTHEVWVLDRERNEALHCAVIALAMFRLANPNLRDLGERLRQQAGAPLAGATAARPAADDSPPPARDPWLSRTHGAGWLAPRRRWL